MPDLITIPGIPELWMRTQGNPQIKIAILDGAADLDRACFKGAKITQFKPYWAEDIELNDEYYHYLKLSTDFNQQQKAKKEDPDHDKEEAKKEREAFFEQFPKEIRQRIELSSHATHIASTILGQHGSPVPGIAPNCTAINIPISFAGDDFISPINLTHAINEALKAGVNIIHIAACHPTQTGIAPDLFARAVKQCQDNNILIVAPGGNDKGECWCIPSILPDVLTVGAMRDNGQPFKFSNYGGEYQHKGVMANGENILGAEPGTDVPIRQQGTSCAAPIVTGISALLMSMQLQRGEKPNAEKVRQAILKSAIPCDPKEVEEPERCLLGKLNIPGAYELITEQKLTSLSISFSSKNTLSSAKINSGNEVIINERYILDLQPIGTATTTIYQAVDISNPSQKVAIKVFKENLDLPKFFQALDNKTLLNKSMFKEILVELAKREKEALTVLKHPSIITMLNSGIDEQTGDEFIVLELMKANLLDYLQTYSYTDWNSFYSEIALPILEGLEFCHDHHYIHRDIHPTNILIDNYGNVKLADFNISKKIDQDSNSENAHITCISLMKPGRGIYIPPEPSSGLNSYTRDVFAFGILLIDCLTNFELSNNNDVNYQNVLDALEKLEVPLAVKKIIHTAISLDPEKRAATAGILLRKFAAIEQQGNISYFRGKQSEKILASALTTGTNSVNSVNLNSAVATLTQLGEGITASAASKLVYVLGTIGYDFGSEARRDSFKQLMPAIEIDGTTIPANPYDASQIVNYLAENPSESKSLIWTINQELNPIYALEIKGGFAGDVYEMLLLMLAGQIEPESSDDYIERVSIPGQITDKTITLFSGQEVPVITINNIRGMYGWKVNGLVDAALQTLSEELADADEIRMRRSLSSFLKRVYFDLQNLGKTSKDRALNFAATNAFQAASSFAQAVSTGMELDTIEIEKSPFCRINSDCWDVKLKFFDPERGLRAKKVYLFTIDVSYLIPVTLGQVRSWSEPK